MLFQISTSQDTYIKVLRIINPILLQVKCPVRILHAFNDEEVDWQKSFQFLENIENPDADLIIRKKGNHRLMKPRDLTLLTYTIQNLLDQIEKVDSKPKL